MASYCSELSAVNHRGSLTDPHALAVQEWADNLLLTARKGPAAEERERAASQDSSRCSASPVGAPAGAVTVPGGGSGGLAGRMQRLVSHSKISGGGRLHAATVAPGGLVHSSSHSLNGAVLSEVDWVSRTGCCKGH